MQNREIKTLIGVVVSNSGDKSRRVVIDYKVKHPRFILTKPVPCLPKDPCFDAAHQHYVEHRVVRYENVGGMVLHVPP